MKITLCGSMHHINGMLEAKQKLEALGYEVETPDLSESSGYAGLSDEQRAIKKDRLIRQHMDKISESDAILIYNEEKKGIPGYVGGNSLMEMAFAYAQSIKIFLLNDAREMGYADEIYGMRPTILNGKVEIIHEYLTGLPKAFVRGREMNLYRFSPIKTKEELLHAVTYIAGQSNKLCEKITDQPLPITYLTVFAHYPDEYDELVKIASTLGKVVEANNGIAIMLEEPIKADSQTIPKLRIRQPDPYRTQVGCNDFDPGDYQKFKETYLAANPNNLRVIERPEYEMIEFYDPDFDVFSYVVSK